jgi:hypothetical protein
MAHTHEFDCKACGAHLDSREELDRHNREKHTSGAQSGQSGRQSGMDSSSRSPSNQSRNQS